MRKRQKEPREGANAGKRGLPGIARGRTGEVGWRPETNDGERITSHMLRKRWPPGRDQGWGRHSVLTAW